MQKAKLTGPVMYLWRPAPVVSIGRFQNPWVECKLAQMEEEGVGIVRRRTGGGAVFQDRGGTVFTFLGPADDHSVDRNFEIIIKALQKFGVKAERKGRNDMVCQEKKMSGSAFKHDPTREVSLHHGTLLVNTDMTALSRYLTPDKRKLQAKGIKSVAARVMNMQDEFPEINHESLCEALIAEFRAATGATAAVEELTPTSGFCTEPAFKAYLEELENPDWNLGKTMEFSHHLDTRIDGVGVFDVHMEVVEGKIADIAIFSDALYPDIIEGAMKVLKGVNYGRAGVREALAGLKPKFTDEGPKQCLEAFEGWLVSSLED